MDGFDQADYAAIAMAFSAIVGVVWTKRTSNTSTSRERAFAHAVSETVDDSVLGRFDELFSRITALELDLGVTKRDLEQARLEIRELRKLEEYLQARLHEKDKEIARVSAERQRNKTEIVVLREELHKAELRILHLEQVLHRAGLNGEGLAT